MRPGTDQRDPATLTATANEFVDMVETTTHLMEALAPALSRLGRLCAALDQLGASLHNIPPTWTGSAPSASVPAVPARPAAAPTPLGLTARPDMGSTRPAAPRSDSATLVFLLQGGSQPVDVEKIYQTLADIAGVEEVIPGAYSRDRAAFDLRTSRPAHELAIEQALKSAIPEIASWEWTASGEFVVVIRGSTEPEEHEASLRAIGEWQAPATDGAAAG
jgi:hypothetical protein